MRRLGILCLGVLLWLLFRTLGKKTELRLFENGQIALARVTGSSTRSRFMPSLAYEFTDPKGVVTCGEPMVLGGTVVEGDSIIVFYDLCAPQCVPLLYYKIRVRSFLVRAFCSEAERCCNINYTQNARPAITGWRSMIQIVHYR